MKADDAIPLSAILAALRPGQSFTVPAEHTHAILAAGKQRGLTCMVDEGGNVEISRPAPPPAPPPPRPAVTREAIEAVFTHQPESLGTDHAQGPQRFAEAPPGPTGGRLKPFAPSAAQLQKEAEIERSEAATEAHARRRQGRKVTTDSVARLVDQAMGMEPNSRIEIEGLSDGDRKKLRFRLAYGPAEDVRAKGPFRVIFVNSDVVRIERGTPPASAATNEIVKPRPSPAIARMSVNPQDLRASAEAGLPPTPLAPPGRLKPPPVDPRMVDAARGGRV